MSNYLGLVLKSIKTFLGDFRVKIDREKRLVTIIQRTETLTLTFDQVIDEIEKLFNEPDEQ